jgi:hypothetical protein
MTIADYFVTSFTAKRMTWTTDVDGNQYSQLADTPSFSGHIQQSSMQLAQSLNLTFTKTYTIWCSVDETVAEGDQLVSGGFTYTVRAKQEFLNGDNAHLELVCEREPYHA